MDGQPLVSVVIPTLNAGVQLAGLLKAITSQEIPVAVEIVVIDSSSRDGTADIARKAGATVIRIPRSQFGHGRTRNQAIQASKGALVALTVQDAMPTDEHWLGRLIAPLLEHRRVAGSYGLQVARPSTSLLARARSAGWCERHQRPLVKSLQTPEAFWLLSPQERLDLIRFDNVTACVRRSVWEDLPFPDRAYGEDLAWSKQVLLRGHRIAYVPESKVWHSHERGWWYTLRRAYLEGYGRVQLVNWPSPGLSSRDALRALRRMLFFVFTPRFDSMVDPTTIRRFIASEIREYDRLDNDRSARIYVAALRFSWGLLGNALSYCPEGTLPEGAWTQLLRFAVVTLVGENLGSNAAYQLPHDDGLERLMWEGLHKLVYRGV